MPSQGRVATLSATLSERAGGLVPLVVAPHLTCPDGAVAAVTVLETSDLDRARAELASAGAHVDLLGRIGGGDRRALAVLAPSAAFPEPVPDAFRVLAVMPAYNEADVVVRCVQGLLDEGVDVHVLDNWSTDGTCELLAGLTGRGALTVERFPERDAPVRYEWEVILRRVEAVAAASGADWCVLHDVDERRRGPWGGRDLRTSLHEVGRRGYNAVDHTVWEYHPVDNTFVDGADVEQVLRYWAPPRVGANRTQIKAWSLPGGHVDLASAGGHEAAFPGRRVFPYHFLLKHYPIRSQAHGERKVLVDRKPRFSLDERRRLWHRHYDHVRTGHDFLWSPDALQLDSDETAAELLVERVLGLDPEPSRPHPLREVARRALLASGLRPLFVAARRRYRITRRRDVETGGR